LTVGRNTASLAELTCSELLAAYRRGDASPVEAVEACLARIEAVDDRLHAVMTLCADQALEQAHASERRWGAAAPLPLDGIPFGLKDIIHTAGIRTTGGSLVYQHMVPEVNAAVVDRLLSAGGVLLAKVHTWEFAADGVPYPFPRNPWNLGHMAAGSSSGSAAAVGAREMPLAIGTDTGGSIRVPTAFCGITSMKPTFGRVSRYGVMPISWTLDHVGPMARSAEDLALALEVIAGHDPRDPSSGTTPVPAYHGALGRDLQGVRIGVPQNWFFEFCDPQVEAAVRQALRVLESAGATAVDVQVPILDQVDPVSVEWLIVNPEAASLHEVNTSVIDRYSHDYVAHLLDGRLILAIDYMRALRLRHLLQRGFERVFDQVDVLITPGALSVAPRIEREDSVVEAWAVIGDKRYPWLDVLMRTTCVFNLTGLPALTLPSGLSEDQLPMAIQLIARPYNEEKCFQVAYAFQTRTDHHRQQPVASNSVGAV
jgi:aspartyl-tRNA(Asn)/glutamyl-tRNA(Gln) amidotransferase subunit A